MNYKLFSILAFFIACLFSSNAYSSALPSPSLPEQPHPSDPDYPKVPKKPNTSLPPANDPDYGKSKWDKVRKNVKKIGKPSFADVAILVLGEAVDYVLDPENNTARKKKYKCDVHFGSSDGHYDMNSFINHVQSIRRQDAYGSYYYRANSKTIERLEQVRKDTLSLYEGGSVGIGNGQWINSANTNFTVDRVRPNSVSSVNLHLGVYVSCINPDYEPEPDPDRDPEPSPRPNPDRDPEPSPRPNPDRDPEPSPRPNPDRDPEPSPRPNPDRDPEPSPDREPKPNEKPQPFELPAFCAWATKVCDFIDWVREEPPQPEDPKQVPHATLSDLGLDEDELFKQRVNFDGQCPQHQLNFVLNGYQIMEPIPTHHFCNLLEQIAPWLLAFSYLSSAFFVIRSL